MSCMSSEQCLRAPESNEASDRKKANERSKEDLGHGAEHSVGSLLDAFLAAQAGKPSTDSTKS